MAGADDRFAPFACVLQCKYIVVCASDQRSSILIPEKRGGLVELLYVRVRRLRGGAKACTAYQM